MIVKARDIEPSSAMKRQVSSAYCEIFHSFGPILIPEILGLSRIELANISTMIRNSSAEIGHP
jgi:hypothetical protein